jgi:sulfur carrier protein ThiS
MAKADAAEVRQLKYHADDKLLKSVRDRFEAEHGADASPVVTMHAAKEAESIGAKPVVVSSTLKELLEKGGLSAETIAAKMEGTVEARFAPSDLTLEEREASDRLEQIVPVFVVVSFRGTKIACRLIDEASIVGVERRMLSEPFKKLLTSTLAAEAKRRNLQPIDILLEHVAREKETPSTADITDHEVCDECGKAIPGSTPSMVNMHHHHSCSLHTSASNDPAETPAF